MRVFLLRIALLIHPLCAAADILVHLSWHDAFGLAPLEAMACGLPVVTTRFAGVSELVEDERLGQDRGPEGLEQEQAVASEALALALDGAVGDIELAGDLAQGGAAEEAVEDRSEQAGVLEPVGEGEGL